MSAKIYDETQQAFVDVETPKVYSGSEYVDSKGMSYDGSEWVEDWKIRELPIFNYGNQCTSITGGWSNTNFIGSSTWSSINRAVEFGSDYVKFDTEAGSSGVTSMMISNNEIDTTGLKGIRFKDTYSSRDNFANHGGNSRCPEIWFFTTKTPGQLYDYSGNSNNPAGYIQRGFNYNDGTAWNAVYLDYGASYVNLNSGLYKNSDGSVSIMLDDVSEMLSRLNEFNRSFYIGVGALNGNTTEYLYYLSLIF
jgi:hypothetical protein